MSRLPRHDLIARLRRHGQKLLKLEHVLQAAAAQLGTCGDDADVLLVPAVESVGVQIAPQDHRHVRQFPFHRVQNGPHLTAAARAVGPVFQVDGHGPQGPPAHIQLREHCQPPADAPLAVKVPVVLLRQSDDPRPADGPAGKHGVSVEALLILIVYQLDELQTPGVVQAEGRRQLPGGVFVAGPGAAVVQLVGQDQVEGPDIRAVSQKILNLLQVDTPLHVEHQHPQGFRRRLRRGHEVVGLRLPKLGDHGHDLLLGPGVQQRPQGLALLQWNSSHDIPSCASLFRQVERIISSG